MDFDQQAKLVAYQVAVWRYASTTQAQWQVPLLGMTAEAALLASILAAHRVVLSVVLAVVSVTVALLAPIATRRIEFTAWWDREMLDLYEAELLPESWRLHHALRLQDRLRYHDFALGQSVTLRRLQLRVVKLAPPSLVLNLAVAVVSAACVAVAVTQIASG